METLRLYYPAKPFRITQAWGIYNPAYQQFGFNRHNGIDFALGADKTLYAPCDGVIVRTGNQPTGGGIFLGLMTDVKQFNDGQFHVLIDLLHCEKFLVKEGDVVKIGQKLAIADNTGFSTGPHTHMQPRRVASWNGQVAERLQWTPADKNDANGSFDPMPHFIGIHAQDYRTLIHLYSALVSTLAGIVGELKKKAA